MTSWHVPIIYLYKLWQNTNFRTYCAIFTVPQTKFAKVMFLHLSVGGAGAEGELASQHALGRRGLASQHALGRGVCIQGEGVCIWGMGLHPGRWVGQTPLPTRDTWDTMGYGQRVGGMHPTGIHSCGCMYHPTNEGPCEGYVFTWCLSVHQGGVDSDRLS